MRCGPSRSSVGRSAAGRLGYRFCDTGLLYRGLTWVAHRRGVDPDDAAGLVALRDGPDGMIDRLAEDHEHARILADYRRLDGSRRHPPGTTVREPLLDVLVHTQDIALPLGRHHAMPPEAARTAADRVWSVSFPFRARRRLRGVTLTATDTDWRAGAGPEVRGPMEALLLLLTGRTAALDRLEGPGLALVAPGAEAARGS